jgi:hypothetical protein
MGACRGLLIVLAALALGFAPAPFPREQRAKGKVPSNTGGLAEKPAVGDILLEYREFRDESWSQVFHWLAGQPGNPVVLTYKPAGTFTFAPPAPGRRYTVGEFLAIVNTSPGRRGWFLGRSSPRTFALFDEE